MATVDLNHVQFWAPPSNLFLYKQRTTSSQSKGSSICTNSSRNQPALLHNKADRIFKRNDQSAITAARHYGDSFVAGAQGRNNDSTNCDDEADDDLPSIEEILGLISHQGISTGGDWNAEAALQDLDKPALDTSGNRIGPKQSRLDNGVGDSQGTRDRPVILEDDEPDTPDPEAAAVSASVDAGADFAFEMSKLIDPSDHEAWYDVEAGCYIDEELPPGLEPEQEGLAASTPVHDHGHSRYHSPGPSHDRIGQYDDDGNTQRTSEEPRPYTLPKPLDEDGGGESGENVSELEMNMLLAFEEQEKSSSATAPSSPRPHRHSTEQPHPRIDREHDQGGTNYGRLEGLRHSSPLCNQDQEEEPQEQQRLEQQEVAVDAIREGEVEDDGDDREQRGKRGEKRRRQDGTEEVSSNIHQSEGSDCSHNANDKDVEDDEDDEEPRPAKRRKLPLASTHKALTPPLHHNSKARLRQPHSIMPPLATQLEVDDTQSQADPGNPPTASDDGQHHISRTSRSPSPTESVPIAEYQEWPFQGFLKRTKIGSETTYNLEFKLPCISGRLNIPINPKALDIYSSREAPAKAAFLHEAAAHSKMYPAALRPQIKRAPWTPEEDATLLNMRNEGCSWEDIHAALPHRSKGTIQVRYSTKLKNSLAESGGSNQRTTSPN